VLDLRRDHPCGSRRWTVVRLGADIGRACSSPSAPRVASMQMSMSFSSSAISGIASRP
jgi:hypothetical protein